MLRSNPPAVATMPIPASAGESWWADPRFQLPAVLLGASVLATGTFAILHLTMGRKQQPPPQPTRTDLGFVFPDAGYVLCPQGIGLTPTNKPIEPGTMIVIALGDPKGRFVEYTWALVRQIDKADPNRIFVEVWGEKAQLGKVPLRTDQHGFELAQLFWMTRDCVTDAMVELHDPEAFVLCASGLVNYDGPDEDQLPDGYFPAQPPVSVPSALLGREVELLLVSKAGKGTAWSSPIAATIIDTGKVGELPRVRVTEVQTEPPDGVPPQRWHSVKVGDEFDVTYDCITHYR